MIPTRGFVVLFFLLPYPAAAQDIQRDINEQVWRPFIIHFNNHDADGLLSVHSRDVVRSPRDSKTIFGWGEYLRQQTERDSRAKKTGHKRLLELRFTERIVENNLAIEVGVYKTTNTDFAGHSQDYFGRFHVVLRKENDTDSSESGTHR